MEVSSEFAAQVAFYTTAAPLVIAWVCERLWLLHVERQPRIPLITSAR